MKIKVVPKSYEQVLALPRPRHKRPIHPSMLLRLVIQALALPDMLATHFSVESQGMERLGKEPCLILMNHSSFIDLKIAHKIFFPRPLSIVSTTDSFVGKGWLMRWLGCIPTQKFITDLHLVRDIQYALHHLRSSVLLFPEAGYSFDGTKNVLPSSLGRLLKMMNVPVVTVITHGAFSRDPLYNNLQLRRVPVSAEVSYLLSPEEIREKSTDELNALLNERFSFDAFRWQYEKQLEIREPFRADGLNRVLYKCPHCGEEGRMKGEGIYLRCQACGKTYELTTLGRLRALEGETEFSHIPDWFAWQRQEVRREIEAGSYRLELPVDIHMLVDYKTLYRVGEGNLLHTEEGFRLTGCDGTLDYRQKPLSSYTLNADFYWYELGDVIGLGDRDKLFYCFPRQTGDVVTKTRLAAEELYKLILARRSSAKTKRTADAAAAPMVNIGEQM